MFVLLYEQLFDMSRMSLEENMPAASTAQLPLATAALNQSANGIPFLATGIPSATTEVVWFFNSTWPTFLIAHFRRSKHKAVEIEHMFRNG